MWGHATLNLPQNKLIKNRLKTEKNHNKFSSQIIVTSSQINVQNHHTKWTWASFIFSFLNVKVIRILKNVDWLLWRTGKKLRTFEFVLNDIMLRKLKQLLKKVSATTLASQSVEWFSLAMKTNIQFFTTSCRIFSIIQKSF